MATPRRPGVASGNDVTSARWGRRLRELGHEVCVAVVESGAAFDASGRDVGEGSDLLVVLHARRSASAVAASRHRSPRRPIVVGLAGTDLYGDLPNDATARASIDAADQLVVLQDAAVARLASMDPALGHKAHVVYQSVQPPLPERAPPADGLVVVVLAHLREVKDPLLAARAAALLPEPSRLTVVHAGHAHTDEWRDRATEEEARNPRYRWLGEVAGSEALGLIARSSVLACTSQLEGGANVVTEAIALGVPVVGTAIDGNVGLLGTNYPGLVPVGDAVALAEWLHRLETHPELLADLAELVEQRKVITLPETERAAWDQVLAAI